jgi:amino acid transporter
MDSNAAIPPAYVAPAAPQPHKSKKKMWTIIILSVLLAIFLLIVGCCALVYKVAKSALKSSQVYVMSIQRAQNSPCAISKLGQPLAFQMPQGSASENNDSGSADLTIPASGPQGSGSLHVVASRDNKVWTLTSETLNVGGSAYDLPAEPGPCAAQ